MLLSFLLYVACCCQLQKDSLAIYRANAAEWADDVAKLVEQNQHKVAQENDLLFVGSSSIRLWDSIEQDMQGWNVVRRGYGGARYSDLAIYLDQLLENHHPQAILFFVANDIAGDEKRDITPEEIGRLTTFIAKRSRTLHPTTPIFFIEVTPTPKRWHVWKTIQIANGEIQKSTQLIENCYFISTRDAYLDATTGEPIANLFREDQLHLNEQGYARWAKVIQASLRTHLEQHQ